MDIDDVVMAAMMVAWYGKDFEVTRKKWDGIIVIIVKAKKMMMMKIMMVEMVVKTIMAKMIIEKMEMWWQ